MRDDEKTNYYTIKLQTNQSTSVEPENPWTGVFDQLKICLSTDFVAQKL